MAQKTVVMTVLLVLAVALGCTPAGPPARTTEGDSPTPPRSVVKKRVISAYSEQDLKAISSKLGTGDGRKLVQIAHAGLAQVDPRSVLHPQLAEAVPTIENGLWKVLPDGRMETTWKLRPDARWHDGLPVSAEDFVFTARVDQDRELPLPREAGYGSVEGIEALDPQTVLIRWKGPYILADSMFASPDRLVPQHLMGPVYEEDKTQFVNHPYWSERFVGAGPFKVKEFAQGSHVILEAFDQYVLGRPKVDELELRFIPDPSTLVANLLAGTVDLTIGLSIAPDQAAQVRDQWREGQVVTNPYHGDTVAMFPQLLDPALPVITDRRFRAALLHALDREEMAQAIMAGWSGVAHTQVTPALPEYEQIQDSVVRYEFDLRKSAQLIEELGYRRGASGLWEDASGQRIVFQNWASAQDPQERVRGMLTATDYWKRFGLEVEPYLTPPGIDAPTRAQFPAFSTRGGGGDYSALMRYFHSTFAPTPENRFAGTNPSRVMDPELDRLLDAFFNAIPRSERTQALRSVVRYQTEQVLWMGYYYNPQLTLLSNKLREVTPSSYAAKAFNAHLWETQ